MEGSRLGGLGKEFFPWDNWKPLVVVRVGAGETLRWKENCSVRWGQAVAEDDILGNTNRCDWENQLTLGSLTPPFLEQSVLLKPQILVCALNT